MSTRIAIPSSKAYCGVLNNYLGLSNHGAVRRAAIQGIKEYGYGVASVRFICGTQDIHFSLEKKISRFLGTEDTILFSSCWAANEAFFASLTNEKLGYDEYRDVIYSDRLNHASIIDGQRLCRAETTDRKIYKHADTEDLQRQLEEDKEKPYRLKLIATDGVFSMEGDLAPLDKLVEIADRYGALLFIDDSHGVGVCGRSGRGTPEAKGVHGRIDVATGTLGNPLAPPSPPLPPGPHSPAGSPGEWPRNRYLSPLVPAKAKDSRDTR